ncbi:MAG: PKD domain-containing protein, partial [bacterium]
MSPIRVVIEDISSQGVTVANADGIISTGKPFLCYSFVSGQLSPGETTAAKRWEFYNPNRARFIYSISVWADFQQTSRPPIANAGPDQTVRVTDTVTLDGTGSSDEDGDALTYSWSFVSVPAGSGAALSDAAAVNPAFVVDAPGTYVAQLIVNDGTVDSAADTVVIDTENTAPVADAGPDRTAHVTDTVTLDGTGSSDVDGDALTYSWSLVSIPAGSSAVLFDPTSINPAFVVDVPGTYVAQLIVNDGTVDSAADTVVIDTENTAPVADAGPDRTAHVTDTVTLDGKGSSDVDGDALTYSWSFVSR